MFILSNYVFLGKDFHFVWKVTILGENTISNTKIWKFKKKLEESLFRVLKTASEISKRCIHT